MPLGPAQSLITRCPGCGTAFRASAEQLSLRHGLVRCGRCGHVFDARTNAVDIEPAVATPTANIESPPTAFSEKADDEPLYDATSFIAADVPLASDAGASGEPAGEVAPESRDTSFDTAPDASDPGHSSAQEAEHSDQFATETETATEPAEQASESAADPGGQEQNGTDDGAATVAEAPPRPFAEVLEQARAEHLDDDGPADEASTPTIDESQQEDADDSPSEAPQDNAPPASAEAGTVDDATKDTPPVDAGDEPLNTDGSQAEVAADEPAMDTLPDDRLDPIDAAVAAMPPAGNSPPPGAVSTVEPLELEFGAPRSTQPGISKWLGIPGAILLLAALAGQVAYHLRGDLVLLFPSVRATAVQLCDWAGCDLPSPQRAELMSIESSDLQADSINPAVMVLSATLRNRAPFAQAQPALELTLTDAQDQPVARRVIDASDYVIAGIQNGVFPASSELPVKIYFEASAVKATGYRLYLFYP